MTKNNVIDFKKPEFDDPITDILRQGARRLLTAALETEIELFLEQYKELTDDKGCQQIVRNGHQREREIQTGIGQIAMRAPRARDRRPVSPEERIRFNSAILPPYIRRTKSIETLLPWLYLKRDIYGRLYRTAGRAVREKCSRAFAGHDQPPEGCLAG